MHEGFQLVSSSVKETCYLCHLPPWEMLCLSLQLSKWLLVSLSQLAEPALGWNWCAIQLERQILPPALLSPFVTGRCSMTSYSEAGREKNVPKMTCSSYLFLIHLCLGEIFALGYVLFPTLSHVSSFLSSFSTPTFSYNGKTTSPAVQPSWMTWHVQVQADRCLSYFWIIVEVVSSDFSDCCMVFFLCHRYTATVNSTERWGGRETDGHKL